MEGMVDLLRTQWSQSRRELLIDQKAGMAQSEVISTDQFFKKLFIHSGLDND
jgi:hypothetical protein